MSKYRVYLCTVASTQVEVEADSGDEAVEIALLGDVDLPYAPGLADYEFGEWTTGSELFPQFNKPEGDWEELG